MREKIKLDHCSEQDVAEKSTHRFFGWFYLGISQAR